MQQKIRNVQGLRGWAMLMIVLWHLNTIFPRSLPKLGDRGVEFFLLISGFLIARKCDSENSLDSFSLSLSYVRRKIRGFYGLLVLPAVPVFLLDVFAGPQKIEIPGLQLLAFCTLTQSWIPDERLCWAVSRIGWFLPVLLFCYLMTPVILKTVRRFGARAVLVGCFAVQLIAEVLAMHFLPVFYYEWLIYLFPAFRILDFTLGFCAWHLFRTDGFSMSVRRQNLLFVGLLASLIGLSLLRPSLKYVLFHPFELLVLVVVASEKSSLANALNRNRLAVYIGNLSRIIFFTHLPVIRLTGMIWRRFFSPDLLFPLWAVSLIAVFLTAETVRRLQILFGRRK